MKYRTAFMIKAFSIILSGFKQPGRQMWTYHIAEAISRRTKIEIFEIFRNCFFFLLFVDMHHAHECSSHSFVRDESVFRIGGAVNLQTLSFRCPAVAHEIAVIISHLAKKDHVPRIVLDPSEILKLEPGDSPDSGEESGNIKASFSNVIIHAGFLRLAT